MKKFWCTLTTTIQQHAVAFSLKAIFYGTKERRLGFEPPDAKKQRPARPNTVKTLLILQPKKRPLDKILRFTEGRPKGTQKIWFFWHGRKKGLYINLCQIFSMRKSLGLLLVSHLCALLIAFCLIRLMVMVITCVFKNRVKPKYPFWF